MQRLFWIFALSIIVLTGCQPDEEDLVEDTLFSTQLAALESGVITPALVEMDVKATVLEEAILNFTGAPNPNTLTAAREALREARIAYQSVSMLRFGPGETLDLQARVNTFPADTVAIENLIQNGTPPAGTQNDEIGFAAIEWLLYGYGNEADVLNAYTTAAVTQERISYLNTTVNVLVALLAEHKAAWDNGYRNTFRTATGASAGSGMSMYVNGLVKDYETLKREKVALPLGLLTLGIPLPDKTEAYHAGYSLELAKAHLDACRHAFTGGEGTGLDDLLDELDAFHSPSNQTLSNAILNQLDAGEAGLNTLSDPLSGQIESDPALVEAAYDELQAAVVLLKADMPSALGISITFTDNDGD
jgi:hypothetical protein